MNAREARKLSELANSKEHKVAIARASLLEKIKEWAQHGNESITFYFQMNDEDQEWLRKKGYEVEVEHSYHGRRDWEDPDKITTVRW